MMGYTHYWTTTDKIPTDKQIKELKHIVDKAIEYGIDVVGGGSEFDSEYEITKDHIWLNGVETDGCETFGVQFGKCEWDFCKTRLRPYDAVVVVLLRRLAQMGLTEGFDSDGCKADGDFHKADLLTDYIAKGS